FNNDISSSIIIFDMLGRKVYDTNNQKSTLKIDVSSWNSGMYTFKIKGDGYQAARKIIIN
ncbi:MAG: hypothetical protein ACI97R_001925, partial [Candidatus Azotimanducaceae bacterium]